VYGETLKPATERTLPAPLSFYGFHKYAAEHIVRTEGVSHTILRPANVYGPRQRSDAEGGVVAIFLERLRRDQFLMVHGDGRQVRDFIYVSDVIAAVRLALSEPADTIWNVGTANAVSIAGLAAQVGALLARQPRLAFRPGRNGDVSHSVLSSARLLATGQWGPPLSLPAGLRAMLTDAADQSNRAPLVGRRDRVAGPSRPAVTRSRQG
jgi:UDP-glucose 4-epimerase